MKKMIGILLAIIMLFQISSIVAIDNVHAETLKLNMVWITVNKEFTQNGYVFTEDDFPGVDIKNLSVKYYFIRSKDGSVRVSEIYAHYSMAELENCRGLIGIELIDHSYENALYALEIINKLDFVESALVSHSVTIDGNEAAGEDDKSHGGIDHSEDGVCSFGVEHIPTNSRVLTYVQNGNEKKVPYSTVAYCKFCGEILDSYVARIIEIGDTVFTDSPEGDVNLDWSVNVADARAVLRRSIGLEADCYSNKADVNSDGVITVADARTILRMAIGLA